MNALQQNDTSLDIFDDHVELVPVGSRRRINFLVEGKSQTRPKSGAWLALLLIVLPTVLAAVYYFGIAADRYEAEVRFAVRRQAPSSMGALSDILQVSGATKADDEAFAVNEFILSRDAMAGLVKTAGLNEAFDKAGIDPMYSFDSASATNESRFKHYRRFVFASTDSSTGISSISVQAFTPQDAKNIAEALLTLADDMINKLNDRAANDALEAAQKEAADMKERLDRAQAALLEFRTKQQIVDPAKLSVSVLQTIALLSIQMSEAQAALSDLEGSTPNSPQVAVLRHRIAAIQQQIAIERKKLGGDDTALAAVLSEYESLVIEREFSQRAYSAAMASVEMTKNDNRKQRVYIEHIVEPHEADEAQYPSRFLWVAVVFGIGLVLWAATARILAVNAARRAG